MKTLIIAPKELYVPAIKGGAVETLITHLINENEKSEKLNIDVVTQYSKETSKIAKNFRYTRFIFVNIDTNILLRLLRTFTRINFLNRVRNKLSNIIYNHHIIKAIKKYKYDVIITEGGQYKKYEKVYACFPKEKSILHIHSSMNADYFCEQKYQYYIDISKFAIDSFLKNSNIDRTNVFLLENCIDEGVFLQRLNKEEYIECRNRFNIKPNEKVVLFCGRTVEEKGVKELISAFKRIKHINNTKLLIVGSTFFGASNEKNKYEKELVELSKDIKDKIVFSGYIPNKELYKVYQVADLAVFPHICEEGFGLTVVEAMTSGLPIITTNSGAIPDLLKDYINYKVIPKEDKNELINSLSQNMDEFLNEVDKLKLECSKKANLIANKYSTRNYYNNYVKILKECLYRNENRNNNISKRS